MCGRRNRTAVVATRLCQTRRGRGRRRRARSARAGSRARGSTTGGTRLRPRRPRRRSGLPAGVAAARPATAPGSRPRGRRARLRRRSARRAAEGSLSRPPLGSGDSSPPTSVVGGRRATPYVLEDAARHSCLEGSERIAVDARAKASRESASYSARCGATANGRTGYRAISRTIPAPPSACQIRVRSRRPLATSSRPPGPAQNGMPSQ